jgi:hypothetical protein
MNPRRQSHALLKRLRASLEAQQLNINQLRQLLKQRLDDEATMSPVAWRAILDVIATLNATADKIDFAIEQTDETTVVGFKRKKP